MNKLQLPPDDEKDPHAVEVLRVWIRQDAQRFTLRPDAWDDPGAWGILLVDLARHVARAYAGSTGGDPAAVLARIKEAFDAEWESPTDE